MSFLAIRYLKSRKRQTVLMLLGIFFGTAAYVSISGFMLGFRGYLVQEMVNNNAHVRIQAREEFLSEHSLDESLYGAAVQHVFWNPAPSGRKDSAIVENPRSWYERLSADPRVAAYSPQLTASVIFSNGKATAPATMIGCDPLGQSQVTTIPQYVIKGNFMDLASGGNRVVIGSELQKKLGVNLDQNILVSLGKSAPTPFKVVGIFKTGNKASDSGAYGAIGDVQKVNRTPNQVNEIAVKLHDYSQSAAVATAWSAMSFERVESWDQINANLFDVFKIQDAIRFLSVGAVMIVAAFGIYNVLNMTVMQKRKDIAILRSIGHTTLDIMSLFLTQGLILGITGTAMGLTFGYFFGHYLETLPFSGGPMGGSAGHFIVSRDISIYLQATLLALLATSIASVLPARSAGRLTPIEIIRGGAE